MEARGDENTRDVLERFVHDLGSYSLGSLVPAVFGVVSLIVFTRMFSPAAFGRYALTVAGAAVSSTLFFGWIQQSVLRFETEVNTDTLTATLLALITGLLLVGAVISALSFVFVVPKEGVLAAFFIGGVALTLTRGPFRILQAMFQARLESRRAMKFKVYHAALKFVFALLLAIVVLESILGWVLGAAIGTGTVSIWMMARAVPRGTRPSLQWSLCRRMFRFGAPLLVWMLGLTLLNFADRGLLEWLLGSTAVGVYSSNYSIVARGLPLVLAPMIQTIHPLVMDVWSGDNETEIERLVSRFTRYFLIIGVPATVLSGVASRPLSTILLGPEYHSGFSIIPLVAIGLFLWNLSMVGHKGLEVAEQTTVMSVGISLAVVANIGLNVPLIGLVGYHGAALATLLSFALYACFVYVVSRRYIPWRVPWRSVRNAFVGGGVITLVGSVPYFAVEYSLSRTLVASIIGIVLYIGVLYALGEFEDEELYAARSVLGITRRWLG